MDGPAGRRGKWSQPGVPHRGWHCENVEDLGQPSLICDMCETMEIRYVHYMRHTEYPSVLACGEICAGHMEGDLVAAQERDRTMKSSARKRKAFPGRTSWTYNSNGNPQIKTDHFRVTMFQKSGAWKGVVYDRIANASYFTRDTFGQLHEAKLAAFDTLIFAKSLREKKFATRVMHGSSAGH